MLIDIDSDMYFVFRGCDLHNAHTNILQNQFRDGGGGKGSEAMHIFLCKEVPNLVKPAYVILECSLSKLATFGAFCQSQLSPSPSFAEL